MSASQTSALVVGVHSILPGTGPMETTRLICLYRNKQVFSLPAFPAGKGIRPQCQITSVNRAIHVLGGLENRNVGLASQDVYTLDLLAPVCKWQQRSNMNFRRANFGAGVLNGKIYVFGGSNCGMPVLDCEVFDPKLNTWSILPPMPLPRVNHKVAVLGDLFYLYGGKTHFGIGANRGSASTSSDCDDVSDSTILVYDPKGGKWFKWAVPEDRKNGLLESNVFVLNECFHRLTREGIYRYDMVEQRWTTLQLFEVLSNGRALSEIPIDLEVGLGGQTVLVGDELLTVGHFKCRSERPVPCLLQTRRFGTDQRDIVLELVQSNLGRFENGSTQIFPLDL